MLIWREITDESVQIPHSNLMPMRFPDWRLESANKFLRSKEMVPNLHGEKADILRHSEKDN